MKKLVLLSLLVCFVTISCDKEESTLEQPLIDYQAFSKELGDNLNQIATALRSQSENITSKSFRNIAETILTHNSDSEAEFRESFSFSFNRALAISGNERAKSDVNKIYVTYYQYDILKRIEDVWRASSSPALYTEGLKSILAEVENSNESIIKEKNPLLVFISSQIVANEFIEDNLDLLGLTNERGREEGDWWDDWGKCAAGIVGGTLTGGLGGAGIGAGIGAALGGVPALPGAIIGGVVGAIGGGLTGAAVACGGGNNGVNPITVETGPCDTVDTCGVEEGNGDGEG